jgi:hypothetical protein
MTKDYILHQSDYIVNNQNTIFEDINEAHRLFNRMFASIPDADSTWSYDRYNIFALTAPCSSFYEIYKEMRNVIRNQLGDTRPLWFEAWLNYHTADSVLDWHTHTYDYHGYICIDSKKTNTVFDNYSIENKTGQIYFGPGNRRHRVEVLEPFEGYRTTIGFDVHCLPEHKLVLEYVERPFANLSLMPLL